MKHLTFIITLLTLFVSGWVNFAFSEEKPLIRSTVVDVDGNPVKGAYIFFYDSEDTKRAVDLVSPVTDENGFCQKAVPPGTYWVLARLKREGDFDMGPLMIEDKVSAYPEEIQVAPGEELDLTFTVMDLLDTVRTGSKQREDLNRVSGRVVNTDGEPVKEVFVFANRHNRAVLMPRYFSAWTDDDGLFNIFVPDGEYYLGVSSQFAPDLKYTAGFHVKVEGDLAKQKLVFRGVE